MSNVRLNLTREDQARAELGHTEIRPAVAWVLVLCFVVMIVAVPVVQTLYEWRTQERVQALTLLEARPTVASLSAFETALEDSSIIGQWLRPHTLGWLVRIGVGTDKVYIGRDGWLFYEPDVRYVKGRGFLDDAVLLARSRAGDHTQDAVIPDPRPAILRMHQALRERGITLILMPTPVKPQLYPDRMGAVLKRPLPYVNPSFERWASELREQGVLIYDPAPLLVGPRHVTAQPLYLDSDTHWTPQGMQMVARGLADFIFAHVSLEDYGLSFHVEQQTIANLGDIALMLQLHEDQTLYQPQTVTVRRVLQLDQSNWRPSREADVLVLGDSFSNIFSLEGMGWGESAGLIEQLAYELKRPIDRIVLNDNASHATRRLLDEELRRGRDRLEGKRVVVWQFAARELASGHWPVYDMQLGDAPDSRFIVPEPGETRVVSGTIAAIASVPRPAAVVYRDQLTPMHLVDVHDDAGQPIEGAQVLVYVQGMRDGQWTEAARFREGQRVTVRLRDWSQVPAMETIKRGTLDSDELLLAEDCYGELVLPSE